MEVDISFTRFHFWILTLFFAVEKCGEIEIEIEIEIEDYLLEFDKLKFGLEKEEVKQLSQTSWF